MSWASYYYSILAFDLTGSTGKALKFASNYCNITADDEQIIMSTKNSVLVNNGDIWCKKNGTFDVAMGSYDEAETCELAGTHILSMLSKKLGDNLGLYIDDDLAAVRATPRQADNLRKDICKDLKITIDHQANS